jgi:hypothetical protein
MIDKENSLKISGGNVAKLFSSQKITKLNKLECFCKRQRQAYLAQT